MWANQPGYGTLCLLYIIESLNVMSDRFVKDGVGFDPIIGNANPWGETLNRTHSISLQGLPEVQNVP
jgi:hypothetical protein